MVAAHACGLKAVAVSAGYITPEARTDFFAHIDAANIDLKAFTEQFYRRLSFAALAPVLDTLYWIKRETDVWLEVITLAHSPQGWQSWTFAPRRSPDGGTRGAWQI